MDAPEVRYTRSGETSIAYATVGDGPFDLVFAIGWIVSALDIAWEGPPRHFFERLASFSRLILFDKRGTGMSDRVSGIPDTETRMDDLRAVMDAVGSERAAIMGVSEGGPMALLFGATYPERTAAVIVEGTGATYHRTDDHPWLDTHEDFLRFLEHDWPWDTWGSQEWADERLRFFAPTLAEDPEVRRWFRRWATLGGSPSSHRDLSRMNADLDVRAVLPTINVPTLVLHVEHEKTFDLRGARYIADNVPGAELVVIPGDSHAWFAECEEPIAENVKRFLTSIWDRGEWEAPESERVLATILFTDLVGSTARAAEIGDRAWRELVSEHHVRVRRQLTRFRGVELDTAGDGFFARFDGPARAIRCARAVGDSVRDLGLDVRAGVHTGECEVMEGKVGGIAVHIGARVAAEAGAGEVCVSQTVKDLVAGSGITFRDKGIAELKGVPGEWRLYAVAEA
jgi:pimeloyl-ACP methyl ester carboxylesterase/class 3 adenylate cyclase